MSMSLGWRKYQVVFQCSALLPYALKLQGMHVRRVRKLVLSHILCVLLLVKFDARLPACDENRQEHWPRVYRHKPA
eukprot:6179199-Pleurochrysis_carterae.AAC.1